MASVRTSSRSRTARIVFAFRANLMLAILATLIGGCASDGSTLGDEINAAGSQYKDIGERWDDGESKVKKGRKLISRSRERIRDAEDDIVSGERLIREGEAQMARSRRDYEKLRARSSTVGPAPGS